MPKEKKPEFLLPYTVKGKTEFIQRKDYLKNRSEQLSKALTVGKDKFSLSVPQATQLLKLIESDQDLPEDETTTDNLKEAFKRIKADYEKGVARIDEINAEAEASKGKALKVLNAALEIDKVDRNKLNKKFTSGANFVDVHDDATPEEVAQQLSISMVMRDFSDYAVGDLGNWLADPENCPDGENIIDNLCAKTGRSASTVYGSMRVCRLVPKEKRPENLVPTTLKEIFLPRLNADDKKDMKAKFALLDKASEDGWNSKEARSHVSAARKSGDNKAPDKRGNASKKDAVAVPEGRRYLILELGDIEDGSRYADDFTSFDPDTQHIIDNENFAYATKDADGALKWVDIPVKDAEAEPAQEEAEATA